LGGIVLEVCWGKIGVRVWRGGAIERMASFKTYMLTRLFDVCSRKGMRKGRCDVLLSIEKGVGKVSVQMI